MIRTLPLLVLAAALLGGETTAPAVPAAYSSIVRELAPAGTARPAAVTALHAYVRDRIAETPTSWG